MSGFSQAHAYASGEEATSSGWTRLSQAPPYMQSGMVIFAETYARGKSTVDVRAVVDPATANVVSVTRTPRP